MTLACVRYLCLLKLLKLCGNYMYISVIVTINSDYFDKER